MGGIRSELVRYTMQTGHIGARMWLACANAILLSFLVTGGVGLYQPAFELSLYEEGNTHKDASDETMGGAVQLLPDSVEPEVVPEDEAVEEMVPEDDVVMEEPVVPDVVQPVMPENVIFPVPERQEIIEPIKMVELKKPEPKPRPKPPAPRPRPQTVQSSGTGTGTGLSGAGQGIRTGGAGSKGKRPAPPYPSWARAKGISGSPRFAIVTDAAGTITSLRVLVTSGSPELDAYARDWIQRRWRMPAGAPMTYNVDFNFVLRR